MGIIQIRKAQREGARLVIGLSAISGEGKTFTAIQLAYGLANGDGSKVGFLDTENKRGSLYASDATYRMVAESLGMQTLPDTFLIGDLYAPFSPKRYKQAIEEFQAAGIEVLVLDSASHEYEGEGGYLEIRQPLPGKFANRDNVAAEEHKQFMRALLQSSMHIIVCVRAREKVKIEKDAQGKAVYVPLGLQPIQHRDFMFEMTASLMLHDQGKRQAVLKCPKELEGILGRQDGYITAADGAALRAWVDGAKRLDPKVEKARGDLLLVTEKGLEAFKAAWNEQTATVRKALGAGFRDQCAASAQAFDDARAEKESQHDSGQAEGFQSLNAAAKSLPPVERTQPAAGPASTANEAPADTGDEQGHGHGGQPADAGADDGVTF
jgi:AAA domain